MKASKHHPIVFNAAKNNLSLNDIIRELGITHVTLRTYMQRPSNMKMDHLLILSGLFGMPPEELLYILLRNKPQLNSAGKWYLEEIRNKHK